MESCFPFGTVTVGGGMRICGGCCGCNCCCTGIVGVGIVAAVIVVGDGSGNRNRIVAGKELR